MYKFTLCIVFTILAIEAKNLPGGITTCKRADSDCISKAATASLQILKKGNKDLGLPSLEPIFVKSIHIAGNGGSVDLEQTYTDLKVVGLSDLKFTTFRTDFDGPNCNMHAESLVPYIGLVGNVHVVGKLMLFTLDGSGPCNFTLLDVSIGFDFKCEKFTKDGKEHIKIPELHLDFQPKKVHYEMPDIIPNNREMSDNVINVMNESDMEIFGEVKADYERTFNEIIGKLADIVFSQIPLGEIFVD